MTGLGVRRAASRGVWAIWLPGLSRWAITQPRKNPPGWVGHRPLHGTHDRPHRGQNSPPRSGAFSWCGAQLCWQDARAARKHRGYIEYNPLRAPVPQRQNRRRPAESRRASRMHADKRARAETEDRRAVKGIWASSISSSSAYSQVLEAGGGALFVALRRKSRASSFHSRGKRTMRRRSISTATNRQRRFRTGVCSGGIRPISRNCFQTSDPPLRPSGRCVPGRGKHAPPLHERHRSESVP